MDRQIWKLIFHKLRYLYTLCVLEQNVFRTPSSIFVWVSRINWIKFFKPVPSSIYRVNDSFGVALLTRLRVGLSHLNEHKFRHNFLDTIDPFCSCRTNSIETSEHFLLQCPNYPLERTRLFNDLGDIFSFMPLKHSVLSRILLYGNPVLSDLDNRKIMIATIRFIVATDRFSVPLLNWWWFLPLNVVIFLFVILLILCFVFFFCYFI